jgi:hypothetical protein
MAYAMSYRNSIWVMGNGGNSPINASLLSKILKGNAGNSQKSAVAVEFFRCHTQLELKCAKEECKETPIVLTCLHGHLHQDDTHKPRSHWTFALAFICHMNNMWQFEHNNDA